MVRGAGLRVRVAHVWASALCRRVHSGACKRGGHWLWFTASARGLDSNGTPVVWWRGGGRQRTSTLGFRWARVRVLPDR
eukprot:3005152-Rhodomonas_salina.1